MTEGKIYSTEIVNKTDKPIQIRNPIVGQEVRSSGWGSTIYNKYYSFIPPYGGSIKLKFVDNGYFLCPYERVIYRKNGRVDLKSRKGYKAPALAWPVCTFLNIGGKNEEVVLIADNDSLRLPRGIPITRNVPVTSFYAEFEEVVIAVPIAVQVPDMSQPGSTKTEYRPNIQYEKRSEKELERIKKARERLYLKSVGLG